MVRVFKNNYTPFALNIVLPILIVSPINAIQNTFQNESCLDQYFKNKLKNVFFFNPTVY